MSKATGLPYPGFPAGYPGFPGLAGSGMPPLLPPPAIMSLAMANHLGRRPDVQMSVVSRCNPPPNEVIRAAGEVTRIPTESYSPGLVILLFPIFP